MLKRAGRSKFYRNFIISYIIILFIPLFIMTILVFHSFVGILEEEVRINSINSFKKAVERFQLEIQKLQETSLQIQINNIFRDTDISRNPNDFIKIRNELKKYSVSSFADKIMIYHYDEDRILSTDYACYLKDFVNLYVSKDENKFDILAFRESSENDGLFFFLGSDLVSNFQKSIMYLNKIHLYGSKNYAIIMYLISESSLDRILDPGVIMDDSYVFIKDVASNQIMFSFSDDVTDKINEIKTGLQDANYSSGKKIKIGAGKFSVFVIKSENLDIEFIQVVPNDLLENKVNSTRLTFIIGMIIIIVISGLVIPIFIKINYDPIKKLKELIEHTMPPKYGIKDSLNEIEALEYAFSHYDKKNKELEKIAEEYNDVLKQYLLDCFIMGQAKEIDNMLETCQTSGLNFDKKYYCAIVLKVPKSKYNDIIEYMEQIVNPKYEQKGLRIFVKSDISLKKIITILGSDDNSEAVSREYSIKIMNNFKNMYNGNIRIGIGSCVEDIFDIYLSYRQALMVLDYNYTVSNSYITNVSELAQIAKREVKYPFEIFAELENSIQRREVSEIEKAAGKLLLFIKEENLNLYWAKNICFSVVNIILKQMLMFDKNSSILKKPYIEKIYGTEMTGYYDIEAIMTEIVQDLISYINVGDEAYDVELLQKIVQYIKDNCMDPEFSLNNLANSIQLSPPYLSQYFKKNTNYTISEYVAKSRIRKAKNLLIKTEMSISDIAVQVGYYSVSSFIRKFKSIENLTPGQYKKKYS